MIISFRDFMMEASKPDGVVFLDHRNVWVVYQNGRIMVTKKTEAQAKAWLDKKSGSAPAAAPVKSEPKVTKSAPEPKAEEPEEDAGEDQPQEIKKDFDIPEHNLDYLKAKIEKLNKTAAKLKCKPIELTMGEPYPVEIPHEDGPHRQDGTLRPKKYRMMVKVHVEGEAPKLNGWSFVGKREPMEGTTSIIAKSMPGHELPKKYSDDHDITCEHCKRQRNRSESFVVKKGKKHIEVGRSCLKDFLGHAEPGKYADFAEMISNINAWMNELGNDDFGGGGRMVSTYSTEEIIAAAIRSIKDKGFVSNANAGNRQSTSSAISNHINPPPKPQSVSGAEWHKMHHIPVTDEDKKDATEVIEYLKTHPKAGKEEFYTNLSKLANAQAIPLRMTGYIAAGANGYLREKGEIKSKESILATMKKDEGLGKEGEKIKVKGVVLAAFRYQNDWGTKNILTIKTDSGHLVKMFTMSGDEGVKKGAKVELTGKIGKVEPETYDKSPFKGVMTTTMAPRSRIESVPDAETMDKHFHVGDEIKFTGADGRGKVGRITGKPVFGKFEVQPLHAQLDKPLHISFEDILGLI